VKIKSRFAPELTAASSAPCVCRAMSCSGARGLRREERVACSPQYARPALLLREFLQQRGLADARLAAHERDTTTLLCYGSEPLRQIREASCSRSSNSIKRPTN
jgi:hypothetical protein